jgi:hypothetical protein
LAHFRHEFAQLLETSLLERELHSPIGKRLEILVDQIDKLITETTAGFVVKSEGHVFLVRFRCCGKEAKGTRG